MGNFKQILSENQPSRSVERLTEKISELLTNDERIAHIAVQKKPINIAPDAIALTNKRIVICRPKNLGLSMDFQDFLWREVEDCHVREGVLGSSFELRTVKKTKFAVDYLPKSLARILYRYAQEREEEMTEYRRKLNLENARASAGGFIFSTSETVDSVPQQRLDPTRRLKALKDLFDHQLISQAEYEEKKAEILKGL